MKGIFWFRKSLRLHDNPALLNLLKEVDEVLLIFILDPSFTGVGENRMQFLYDSLEDLSRSISVRRGKLTILHGKPKQVISGLISKHKIDIVGFEFDTEPYALSRDREVIKLNAEFVITAGHTLYDPDDIADLIDPTEYKILHRKVNFDKLPKSFTTMTALLGRLGEPNKPLNPPNKFKCINHPSKPIPRIESTKVINGGETEALKRLSAYIKSHNIRSFNKPKTSPNSLKPSTTCLSPYLKFGCLSVRKFYWAIKKYGATAPKQSSLVGQLLWREFFYFHSYTIPNYHKMKGNPLCRQLKYSYTRDAKFQAWKNGRTGYPWIDAIMRQLKIEGWIHHLARHAVACFLTRGNLFKHWELGRDVFDYWLLDDDYAMNNANWMWLSTSAYYFQHFKVYSPINFGKKTDPKGLYIKKYIEELKDFPSKWIYQPWEAPEDIQKKFGIGTKYPYPLENNKPINFKKI